MRVIAKRTLREFWEKHRDCEQQLKAWFHEAERADWNSPNDVLKDFPRVSALANGRMCFDVKGNRYRLVVKVNFDYRIMWIRFIGTHAEYDKIDANNI